MKSTDVLLLAEQLTERDVAILRTLRTHRLATTAQLRRWHFATRPDGSAFSAQSTATRVTQRVLARLEGHRLMARLFQRVGGVRLGSDSVVWQLDVTGDRLLSVLDGDRRRRYVEPRKAFIAHSVAVTELATRLEEAVQGHRLEQAIVTPEPANWRRFIGAHGRQETLKPDLTAVTAFGDYEDHWFLERDMATEHPSVVIRQAQAYERYASTGDYQREHGVFPAVLWIVPDHPRVAALERAFHRARDLTPGVHRVVRIDDFIPTVLAGSSPPASTNPIPERRD